MQDNVRKLTHGAMMIAILLIMAAISVYVPLLGAVTMLFIPLPMILYRLRYDRSASIFVLIAAIVFSLLGGILLVPVTFTFGLLGFIIGETIQLKKTKLYIFMAAGLTFLLTSMVTYLLTIVLFGVNTIDELTKEINEFQKQTLTLLEEVGDVPEELVKQMDEMFQQTLLAIPSAFIISSFLFAFITLLVNLPIVKRMGHGVPKFLPFRLMKLPVAIVWVYMLVILLPIFMKIDIGSTAELMYVNGSFIIRFLFLLQGISFIHHIAYEMKLKKWLTIVLSIVATLLSPLTVILGILDTGVDIRGWIGKNKSK